LRVSRDITLAPTSDKRNALISNGPFFLSADRTHGQYVAGMTFAAASVHLLLSGLSNGQKFEILPCFGGERSRRTVVFGGDRSSLLQLIVLIHPERRLRLGWRTGSD
jgi:hypothetical protein